MSPPDEVKMRRARSRRYEPPQPWLPLAHESCAAIDMRGSTMRPCPRKCRHQVAGSSWRVRAGVTAKEAGSSTSLLRANA